MFTAFPSQIVIAFFLFFTDLIFTLHVSRCCPFQRCAKADLLFALYDLSCRLLLLSCPFLFYYHSKMATALLRCLYLPSSQFQLRPSRPGITPGNLPCFFDGWQIPGGEVKCLAVGTKAEGKCPGPKTPQNLWLDVKCANFFQQRRF